MTIGHCIWVKYIYIYIYVFHNPLAFYNVCIDKALHEKFTYTRKKVFSHNH